MSSIAFGSPLPPSETKTHKGAKVAADAFAPGQLSPIYIVVRSSGQDSVWTPELLQAVRDITKKAGTDSRVSGVTSLSTVFDSTFDGSSLD